MDAAGLRLAREFFDPHLDKRIFWHGPILLHNLNHGHGALAVRMQRRMKIT